MIKLTYCDFEQASCITSVMSILLSLAASNVKGNTKRAITNALFFIGYCAGCIGAPQLWTNRPRYFEGVITAIVTWCLLILAVIAYWWLCRRENRKRDIRGQFSATEGEGGGAAVDDENEVMRDSHGAPVTDLTDIEDTRFRYSY